MTCPEYLDDTQNIVEDIPKFAFSVEKGISGDIFIGQPQHFISRQSSTVNDDLHANKCVKSDEDALQQSIQLPKEECLSMLLKHSGKPLVSQPVSEKYQLASDTVPEKR